MKTKEILETFAASAIFESLEGSRLSDVKPVSIYFPARKYIASDGYYNNGTLTQFNGKPEGHYEYFLNLKSIPRMLPFYTEGAYDTDSYVHSFKDGQRNYIVRNALFYFGHVTYYFNKLCALFMEEKYEEVIGLMGEYFKEDFCQEVLENYFPESATCDLFTQTNYYRNDDMQEVFSKNLRNNLRSRIYPGRTRRLHKTVTFAKCNGITEYEYTETRDTMYQYMPKVHMYMLMVGYAMHSLGMLSENARFYLGFKNVETEQYHSPPEEEVCSSCGVVHQSGLL